MSSRNRYKKSEACTVAIEISAKSVANFVLDRIVMFRKTSVIQPKRLFF